MAKGRVLVGDSRQLLREQVEADSVASVVTDTPYELVSIAKRFGKANAAPAKPGKDGAFARLSGGFMGQEWDSSGISFDPTFWAEVVRVMKPGAWLLAFGGTRTYHRLACAIEDAGLEVRDCMGWFYATGAPKSRDVGADALRLVQAGGPPTPADLAAADALEGWGTALKPAWEPIVVARKPLSEATIARNCLKHGTGAMNVEACKLPRPDGADSRWDGSGWAKSGTKGYEGLAGPDGTFKTKAKTPEKIAAALEAGRWPPNVLMGHDEECSEETCCPDCVVDFLAAQGGLTTMYPVFPPFLRVPKPSKREKNLGLDRLQTRKLHRVNPGGMERDPRWAPVDTKNHHPTVKPVTLLRYLVRLVTPAGGLVLDPFTGSGTTGVGALEEDRDFLGLELKADYAEVARARLAQVAATSLFAEVEE
jgi:site-specific DNA-methyltransferase (adenine-specific)